MGASVLVTGASSGIGTGVVEVLAEAGYAVHATARRADRLEVLARRSGCTAHVADVTDFDTMRAIVETVEPEVLVLNAGRGSGFEGIADTDPAAIAETVATNVTAVLQLLRLALPGMIARGHGHVVTMGSVAALYPGPAALYGSTKAAIAMITRNLRMELIGSGLRVTDIRPGRVDTEFYDVAMQDAEKAAAAKDTRIRELRPREVAEAVLYAISAPAHVNVSAIELQPVEQSYGGMVFAPAG